MLRILCVENGDSSFSWAGSAGNLKVDDRYFIASVTKLYIPTLMILLREQKRLTCSGFLEQTGAFAFYNPNTDWYFTGMVNQASGFGHSAAFSAMTKTIKSMR